MRSLTRVLAILIFIQCVWLSPTMANLMSCRNLLGLPTTKLPTDPIQLEFHNTENFYSTEMAPESLFDSSRNWHSIRPKRAQTIINEILESSPDIRALVEVEINTLLHYAQPDLLNQYNIVAPPTESLHGAALLYKKSLPINVRVEPLRKRNGIWFLHGLNAFYVYSKVSNSSDPVMIILTAHMPSRRYSRGNIVILERKLKGLQGKLKKNRGFKDSKLSEIKNEIRSLTTAIEAAKQKRLKKNLNEQAELIIAAEKVNQAFDNKVPLFVMADLNSTLESRKSQSIFSSMSLKKARTHPLGYSSAPSNYFISEGQLGSTEIDYILANSVGYNLVKKNLPAQWSDSDPYFRNQHGPQTITEFRRMPSSHIPISALLEIPWQDLLLPDSEL